MTKADLPTMRNHWWPRPGWRPGRDVYTWHITFAGNSELCGHVGEYQRALSGLPGLDLVPPEWLHITVQAVGYADEIGNARLAAVVDAVTTAVTGRAPFTLTFGRPQVRSEAIAIFPEPDRPLCDLFDTIRAAMAGAIGPRAIPTDSGGTHGFRPHVSIAYSHAENDAGLYVRALESVALPAATITIPSVTLIRQERLLAPHWVYRWTTIASAPFADNVADQV